MICRSARAFTLLLSLACLCVGIFAQTGKKTIVIRMLDSKSAKPLLASGFLVRIDHEQTIHADWVSINDDGTGKLTLPAGASFFSIQGTYDNATQTYVNCDAVAGKGMPVDRWYSISEVLTSGIVAPNGCHKSSDAKKPGAKPGEFVFMVRRMSTREEWRE